MMMLSLATLPTPAAGSRRPFFQAIRPGKEVRNEVKKPAQSVHRIKGLVTIREKTSPKLNKPFFELRYKDPETGREVKRRLSGLDLAEAKAVAGHLAKQAYRGKGYLAAQDKVPGLEEGIVEAIRLSRGRNETKADLIRRAKLFLACMANRHPSVKTWADLRPSMVEDYLRVCERAGLAHDSIRLRMVPVKMTWRRMYADYPERVKTPASIKLATPPKREIECLETDEVAALLDWLKAHGPDLWPMACLQGLAGLRVLEAAALRAQDVDLEAKTVTVTDTGHHKSKTRDSYRTIPVCEDVVEALKAAMATMASRKVQPATGELFTNREGNLWTVEALALKWRRTLRHAAARPEVIQRKVTGKKLTLNPHGLDMPRLREIQPHRLRSAFSTMAGLLEVKDRLTKAYMGHASGDVLGEHYRRIPLNELRQVSSAMNGWREAGKEETARKESGNAPLSQAANG